VWSEHIEVFVKDLRIIERPPAGCWPVAHRHVAAVFAACLPLCLLAAACVCWLRPVPRAMALSVDDDAKGRLPVACG